MRIIVNAVKGYILKHPLICGTITVCFGTGFMVGISIYDGVNAQGTVILSVICASVLSTLVFFTVKQLKDFEKFIKLQRVVYPNLPNDVLVMKKERLMHAAQILAGQYLKIVNDCAYLVKTTVSPSVFFYRYNLMIDKLYDLATFEPYIYFIGKLPSVQIEEILQNKDQIVIDFLNRCYKSACEKANLMKTDVGRRNQIAKFYFSLEEYYDRMSDEIVEFIKGNRELNGFSENPLYSTVPDQNLSTRGMEL